MTTLEELRSDAFARDARRALDSDELIADALARAGRRNFSDCTFVEPLRRLLAAYDLEADLSAFGRYSVRFDAMRCLNNLLQFDAIEEREPAVLSRRIDRPIFITGLPRSGTTFLHTLLAQDPAVAVPLSWQMFYPYPSKLRVLGRGLRRAWIGMQFRIMQWLSPELSALHPISADAPQECTDITAQVFQSLRFDSTYRVPSYQSWLDQHGHHDAFRFHRRFLLHLDWQEPGRRWVLKSPDHVFALDAIRAAYPDAVIVFLHRDPVSVIASVAKLTEVLRRPFARHVDRFEIGRQVCASWENGAERMIAAAAERDGILHLHYKDVVAAPMAAVKTLYRHSGLTLDARAERRMGDWLGRATQEGNGQSRYSLDEFGIDGDELRRRFERYMGEFRVAPEREGQARKGRVAPQAA